MDDPFLNKIKSPADIKGLSNVNLVALAAEIRQKIIEVMSTNGGHLRLQPRVC